MNLKIFLVLLAALPVTARVALAADLPASGTYQIRNVKYHELLRPRAANSADGTPIVLYPAQPWKCMTWELQPEEGAVFRVKNLFTAKTFRAGGDTNAPLRFVAQISWNDSGTGLPAWRFTRLTDGNSEITEVTTGSALTAGKSDGESEARIRLAPWRNDDTQKWRLEKIEPQDLTM